MPQNDVKIKQCADHTRFGRALLEIALVLQNQWRIFGLPPLAEPIGCGIASF
jgi:hypothetical protein